MTHKEIHKAIGSRKVYNTRGAGKVSYSMIAAILHSRPGILPSLLLTLIRHGPFRPAPVQAKYVPIFKPGRKDALIPENLGPISLLA